jgi:citrate synthase
MGIQPEMFTVIFAVARTIGWAAHIMEQLADNRIVRPEAEYTGPEGKCYKAMSDR